MSLLNPYAEMTAYEALTQNRPAEQAARQSELANQLEMEKIKKMQQDREMEQYVYDLVQGITRGSGSGPGAVLIDPNKPAEFSNITPEGSYNQGGKGALSSRLRDTPVAAQGSGRMDEIMKNPLVRKHLLGSATGETPEERKQRELGLADQMANRQESHDVRMAEVAQKNQIAHTDRVLAAQREQEIRARESDFNRRISDIDRARDTSLRGMRNSMSTLLMTPAGQKQFRQAQAEAIREAEFEKRALRDAYRAEAVKYGMNLPEMNVTGGISPILKSQAQDLINELPDSVRLGLPELTPDNLLSLASERNMSPEEVLQALMDKMGAKRKK